MKRPVYVATRSKIPVLMLARELDAGGIERDVSKFARHLFEHDVQTHVGCFIPGGMRWRELEAAGIPVLRVPVTSFRSTSVFDAALICKRYIVERGIRIVHAFDTQADIFAVLLCRALGLPVLSSQLCYRDLCPPHTRLILSLIDRIATGVFVNCEAIANHLNLDWKLARKRIHVCHNGFEPQEFHSDARKRLPELNGASTVIGTVAVLRPEKNLGILVDAFARVHKIDPHTRLLIVGSGPAKTALIRRAAERQVIDACLFHESVEKPADWLRAIDVFVLPSVSEGFSNSLLEAMACGCCPVASRVGGTPELICNQSHGMLFESGDVDQLTAALTYLVCHPDVRQRMGDSAAAFVKEHLSIRRACTRLTEIYAAMLD